MVIYCCLTHYSLNQQIEQLKSTRVYRLTPFLIVRNLRAAYLGDSEAGSVSHETAVTLLARAASSKTLWGWRIHFQAHSCSCWKEASVPFQMGFSTRECPQDTAAGFPQSRRSKRQRGKNHIFSNLLEITYYRFYHILLAAQTNPDTKQEGTVQGHGWWEAWVIGHCLGGCPPQAMPPVSCQIPDP